MAETCNQYAYNLSLARDEFYNSQEFYGYGDKMREIADSDTDSLNHEISEISEIMRILSRASQNKREVVSEKYDVCIQDI